MDIGDESDDVSAHVNLARLGAVWHVSDVSR